MTRHFTALLLCTLLAACAAAPTLPPPPTLFHDELFTPPAQAISADALFAMSDEMKRYVSVEIASQLQAKGMQKGLIAALYSNRQLKLEYDAERTRNASEAFNARSGNCLSLVIMTAAFAKHLNLKVTYQSVYTDETWTRNQNTYFNSGHVNITLGPRWLDADRGLRPTWTIDFLPAEDLLSQRSREVSESTIVAMYMNNRAAESMVEGDLNAAYAWARAAIEHEPAFLSAYNTLGVIYSRRGDAQAAEVALRHVLKVDPASTLAMANMVGVLTHEGRNAESAEMARQLARLDPEPPYYFFDRGQAAMREGRYEAARDWFTKEVARSPYQHEFHFWLGMAEYRLGDVEAARSELTLALNASTTPRNQKLYAAKLDRLRQLGVQ